MKEIRKLTADEIELRVGASTAGGKGMLLLYKDARCDMALLDETFGIGNWQSEYIEIKNVLFCKIGVRASATAKGQEQPLPIDDWVWKMSNGIESQGQGDDDPNNVKGEASDAFKRAGFMWGIGRELYEWKDLWVDYDKPKEKYAKFFVKEISYFSNGKPKSITITKLLNYKEIIVYKMENGAYVKTASNKSFDATTINDTDEQEKVDSGVETSLKNDLKQTTTKSFDELENEVKKSNAHIWPMIQALVRDYGVECNEKFEDISKHLTTEPKDYFVKKLKFPLVQGRLSKFELTLEPREALIKGNTVVVYDDKFIEDFKDYLKKEIFLPF